jgi:uncharacterized protein (TIGR03435 family)
VAPVLRVLAAAILVASPAYAQIQIPPESPRQSTSNISFEVVSVKVDPARSRSEAGPPSLVMHPSGRFTALNVTVKQLILSAYDRRASQIAGGPDWMDSQLFDILAQAPDNFEMGQTKQMMRRLLEQRFGLAVQRATKMTPVYSLEWNNSSKTPGRWLRRPTVPCDRPPVDPPEELVGSVGSRRASTTRRQRDQDADPECPPFFGFASTRPLTPSEAQWFYSRRHPVSSILSVLEAAAGGPVIDNTGLTGIWDLDIKFEMDSASALNGAEPRYGSIFSAVREQLGLKLQATKSNVEMVVIERLERPSEN